MPTLTEYEIEGVVKDGDKVDFSKKKLAVHAFVKGKEVAQADVDNSGHYKLAFEYLGEHPATELRVAPKDTQEILVAAGSTLAPNQYETQGNRTVAHLDLQLAFSANNLITMPTKQIWGGVGAFEMDSQNFGDVNPMPGVKMDFSVNIPWYWSFSLVPSLVPNFPLKPHWELVSQSYSGYTYTEPSQPGVMTYLSPYTFNMRPIFMGGVTPVQPSGIPKPPPLPRPSLVVHISQFVNGNWNLVYTAEIDWQQIPSNGRIDFFVPATKVLPQPRIGALPSSIGLLPCDDKHLVKGYAYSQPGDQDRIKGISHQPFCETLHIFGLFPPTPPVAAYDVQIAATNEDYVAADASKQVWEDLTDPLQNQQRDPIKQTYSAQPLGPFIRADGTFYYNNIDTDPEEAWLEHGLKFTWNSRNKRDGFYALRIRSFDQNNKQIGEFDLPVIRIDNTAPEAALEAENAGKCGQVTLTEDGKLTFKITAFDSAGHVLSYGLGGTAGKAALPITTGLESVPVNGNGVQGLEESVTIQGLDVNLQECDPLAYKFTLSVQGSATDGYSSRMSSQLVIKHADLIVAKFKPNAN